MNIFKWMYIRLTAKPSGIQCKEFMKQVNQYNETLKRFYSK